MNMASSSKNQGLVKFTQKLLDHSLTTDGRGEVTVIKGWVNGDVRADSDLIL